MRRVKDGGLRRAVGRPSSGILARVYEALALECGIVSNVTACSITSGSRISREARRSRAPAARPQIFTATNFSLERAERFYRAPTRPTPSCAKN